MPMGRRAQVLLRTAGDELMHELAVYIVALHFTVLGYSGEVLPKAKELRRVFVTESECIRSLQKAKAALRRNPPPVEPDRVACEKLEVAR